MEEDIEYLKVLLNRFAHANASSQFFFGCNMIGDMVFWTEKANEYNTDIIELFEKMRAENKPSE